MKMLSTHYKQLKAEIEIVIENYPQSHRQYTESGLSDMRWRWDLLWSSHFDIKPLHSYLKDAHIDTALRNITGTT